MSGSGSPEHRDVIAFGAHPDDIEMGMGGTIARLTASGRSVLMVSLTRGEGGTHGSADEREKEAHAAAALLGATALLFDFPDTRLENRHDARIAIARLVRERTPALVFAPYHTNPGTHHDGTANRDHMAAGEIVRDGLKLARFRSHLPDLAPHDVRRILYYMVPRGRIPTLIVDVSEVEPLVWQAIEAHATQMAIQRRENSILEILGVFRRYYGVMIGKRLGEPFLSDEPLEAGPVELFHV